MEKGVELAAYWEGGEDAFSGSKPFDKTPLQRLKGWKETFFVGPEEESEAAGRQTFLS